MMQQQQSARKARTKMLIQIGGLLQKSGILEGLHIYADDDLQNYYNREKAAALLGFLVECFEDNEFGEDSLKRWAVVGERRLRGG